ncbi:Glycogen synthase [subsurface metagenome]|nr:glycosyltransferase [Clostridia bacterium]
MKNNVKTKVLYIGPIPPEIGGKESGGIATFCWELATTACNNGYNVYILTDVSASFEKDGIKVIKWPPRNKLEKIFYAIILYIINREKVKELNFLSGKRKLKILYKSHLLKKILKSIRPDFIHILYILDDTIFSMSILKEHPPIIASEYGTALLYEQEIFKLYGFKKRDSFYKKIIKALEKIDYVISCSQFSKLALLREFNLPPNIKVRAILNPINPNKIQLLNKNRTKNVLGLGDKKIVTFCGVHFTIKRKGLDILLKAFAIDSYLLENCKLIIITNKNAKRLIQAFIEKNNIDGLVLSFQPSEKLAEYYNATDVFVMPSRQEGIGLTYYEALLAGVPIIGFFRSVLELEQVLGIYIGEKFNANEENEKDLAEKIIKVLNMEIDGKLLRKKVIENLSWDVKFKEYDLVYRELLV